MKHGQEILAKTDVLMNPIPTSPYQLNMRKMTCLTLHPK